MTLTELQNDFIIDLIVESSNSVDVTRYIGKINSNIVRAAKGARIKPKLSDGKLNRALLRKILKLASPAELEVIATQFLGQNGLKVAKGRKIK